jgi:hypothetical protein
MTNAHENSPARINHPLSMMAQIWQAISAYSKAFGAGMNIASQNEACLRLPDNLTVRSVLPVREDMLKFIDAHETSMIELSDDVQVDISFIQMIEAARVYAATAGKIITLAQPASGALLETLRRSGFLEGMSDDDAKFWLHQGKIQ